MHTKNIVKVETVLETNVEKTNPAEGAYRQPQVHDLGKLEQVQSGFGGSYFDLTGSRSYTP